MTPTIKTLGRTLAVLFLSLAIVPANSMGQNRPQAGDGGGAGTGRAAGGIGGGGMEGPMAPMLQAIRQLNLPADEQKNVMSVIRQAGEDMRDALTGIRQASQQERMEKMQDTQKIVGDAKDKVLGILTPEQKAKYFPLYAKQLVKQATDRTNALQSASTKLEINDDERSQLKTLFEDDLKSLDGYKTDADAVTDDQGATDLQQKVTKLTADTRKQLVSILGQDNVQQLMQSMRPAGGAGRARAGRGGANDASSQSSPSTKPSAK